MVGKLGFNKTVYEFDYFSGSQISIYIKDILVDDINSIQFSVTQSKSPVYGYASQYWHKVLDGQVLVEGTFSIPFKESDYLLMVLQNSDEKGPISAVQGKHKVLRENIERHFTSKSIKNTTDPKATRRTQLAEHELYTDLAALSDEEFENYAESFEDHLWKHPDEADSYLSANVQPGTLSQLKPNSSKRFQYRRADQFPLFDIWILYGDISNKAANHTIKRLDSVSIVGQGQAFDSGGDTIVEQYRFIARNLV